MTVVFGIRTAMRKCETNFRLQKYNINFRLRLFWKTSFKENSQLSVNQDKMQKNKTKLLILHFYLKKLILLPHDICKNALL